VNITVTIDAKALSAAVLERFAANLAGMYAAALRTAR
jgi:hypothetical protein